MNDHSDDHPHVAHDTGHDHALGHGHTHGMVDPSIASSGRGLWAIKWSFIGLAATAILQLAVVFLSGSVALLADTIHNFGDAATAIPLAIAFWFARKRRASASRSAMAASRTWPGSRSCSRFSRARSWRDIRASSGCCIPKRYLTWAP